MAEKFSSCDGSSGYADALVRRAELDEELSDRARLVNLEDVHEVLRFVQRARTGIAKARDCQDDGLSMAYYDSAFDDLGRAQTLLTAGHDWKP